MPARHFALAGLLALSMATPLAAQDPAPVPAPPRPPLFTRNDAIAAGVVTAATLLLSVYDDDIATRILRPDIQESGFLKTTRPWANRINESTLGVGGLALWGVSRLAGQETMADISIHIAEAVIIGSAASQLIRGPLGRARPSLNAGTDQYVFEPFKGFSEFDYRAFPSIHTASGFAAAAVVSGEAARRWPRQKVWITPVAYAIAATPGLARMHLNQHWASDVLMGAFFGTMAGRKVVRYNHEVNPGNKVDRFFLGAGGVDSQNRTVLFEMRHSF